MWKKLAKKSAVLLAVVAVACGIYWQIHKERLLEEYAAYKKESAPILLYHGVGPAVGIEWPTSLILPTELFEQHLQYLKQQGYTVVSVEQLAARFNKRESVEKIVALSFDDGYKNNYSEVLPVLQKYNAKASFFIVNKDIGGPIHMNKDEIMELIANNMEVGSHTINHAPLTLIEEKFLVWETATSKYFLKKQLDDYIVRTIAYPNGGYNQRVIDTAKRYGFYRGLTGKVGANTRQTYYRSPMEMYRITIADDGNGLEGFKERLERAYLWGFLQSKGIDLNVVRDIFM